MSVVLSPVGLSAAPVENQLNAVATYKEKLSTPFPANMGITPQVNVSYTHGVSQLIGSTVFVPIVATISVLTPSGCCKTTPQVYTERFVAAFQGRSAEPTSVTITTVGTMQVNSAICHCKVHGITLNDSIVVTIA